MKSVALSTYINSKLRVYQYVVPVVVALVVSVLAMDAILYVKIKFDQSLLREISPHISTLVETQDRTELLRLIRSIAEERGSKILLVHDDQVTATSEDLHLIDRPYSKENMVFRFLDSDISKNYISSSAKILRPNGPDTNTLIILKSPLLPTLGKCFAVMGIFLLLGFGFSYLYAYRMKKVIQKAIEPIQVIGQEIQNLKNIEPQQIVFSKVGISEFDSIRETISETQKALVDTKEIQAKARAKEMTNATYQKLIHDMTAPVSALEQMAVTAKTSNDVEDREKAVSYILDLASQILSQMKAAKDNLEIDIKMLSPKDLRKCVEESIFQSTQGQTKVIKLQSQIPDQPIVVAHDHTYMTRALNNLITNAIQACKKSVFVSLIELNGKISIRVEDDGPGFPFEDVSLYLTGKGESTKSNRRAYGLASANHIVQNHGGRIVSKDSSLGGACLEVQL